MAKTNSSFFDNLKNMNYKSDFICTYKLLEDDEDNSSHLCYQMQLLQALNMTKFDDFIITKNIEAVYFFIKDYSEIVNLLIVLKEKYKNSSMAFFIENEIALFQLLFSYDYFDVFHKCLCNYIKSKTQTLDLIIDKKYFDELYIYINNSKV
jgi:hypothetical protein